MEARAAYAGNDHREEDPGNMEVLADWAASWRQRVYGVAPSAEAPAGVRPGEAPSRVGGANLPAEGGGAATFN